MVRFVAKNLERMEKGLRLYKDRRTSEQFHCSIDGVKCARVDLLAVDRHGAFVPIECKLGPAIPDVLGQIHGYMACIDHDMRKDRPRTRGIVVAVRATPLFLLAARTFGRKAIKAFECPDNHTIRRVL